MSSTNSTERTFTTAQIENFTENSQGPKVSLCIPRVFSNINWRRVKRHMIEANLGFVEEVHLVPVYDRNNSDILYKRAFVHFRNWNTRDPDAAAALEVLKKGPGSQIRIVYEDPWYWRASISLAKRPTEPPRPRQRTVAIELDEGKRSDDDHHREDNADESGTLSPDASAATLPGY